MITTYLIASAILFSLMTISAASPPHKPHDALGAALMAAFAVMAWVAVALRFGA